MIAIPILSLLTLSDYRRLIRREKRRIRTLKRQIDVLEDRPLTPRQMNAWMLGIVLGHVLFVAAALILHALFTR